MLLTCVNIDFQLPLALIVDQRLPVKAVSKAVSGLVRMLPTARNNLEPTNGATRRSAPDAVHE